MYTEAQIVIGLPNEPVQELPFTVRKTPIAQRWASCLRAANQLSRIREGQRWYNFPGNDGEEGDIAGRISSAVDQINRFFPDLITEKIDRTQIQESVNRIHVHFADIEQNPSYVTTNTRSAWNELNNSLHGYESFLRSRETQKNAGIPECNIVVTWDDPQHTPLEPEDYQHFTVAKKFGTIYVNYCQTGRHLFELFLANDQVAFDEHILPLRKVSADSYIWLGSTTGPKSLQKREQDLATWFQRNSQRLNQLGFHWGDPRLAIGWLPVADLKPELLNLENQLTLVKELGKTPNIIGMDVS